MRTAEEEWKCNKKSIGIRAMDSGKVLISNEIAYRMAYRLYPAMKAFYDNPKNVEKFEKWKAERDKKLEEKKS